MIIAVDFDGILAETTDSFPDIGPPIYPMISFIRELIDGGHEVVLWTSRVNDALKSAVSWCADRGLHFSAVNSNAHSNLQEWVTDPRKIWADIYIDDHEVQFMMIAKERGHETAIARTIKTIRRMLECTN